VAPCEALRAALGGASASSGASAGVGGGFAAGALVEALRPSNNEDFNGILMGFYGILWDFNGI